MNFWNLFRFSPRASREEYALISLGCALFSLITTSLQFLFDPNDLVTWPRIIIAFVIAVIFTLMGLMVIWIDVATAFRRLHDMSLSGAWYIFYLIVSIVLIAAFLPIWWLGQVLSIAFTLFLCLKKSSPVNRFGNPPAAFLPSLFSRKGMFAVVVILGILLPMVRGGLSNVYIKQRKLQQTIQLQQRAAQIHQQAVQLQQQKRAAQTKAPFAPSQRQTKPSL